MMAKRLLLLCVACVACATFAAAGRAVYRLPAGAAHVTVDPSHRKQALLKVAYGATNANVKVFRQLPGHAEAMESCPRNLYGELGDGTAAKWDANPLAWQFDARRRAVFCMGGEGTEGLAMMDAPRCAKVRVAARVTPEQCGTNGWATLGVAMADDARNFWHVAFVQAPPEHGGRRCFELAEMRDGHWLAHLDDKLAMTKHRGSKPWQPGETYEVVLESDASGIRGCVKDGAGACIWEAGYAFPAPDAASKLPEAASRRFPKVRAVTCGRPALRTTGGFCGTFTHLNTACAEARPLPPLSFPPYAGESFVPGVVDRATGFFRVVSKDGRWWVVDPKGRGMALLGIDHATYHGHYSERTHRSVYHEVNKITFPDKRDWEKETLGRLKAWGFNALGAGCDVALQRRGLVHTAFLAIGDALCRNVGRPELFICPNERRPCSAFPNVFHPRFAEWADYLARKKCAPNKNDPWLFGYFLDNELAWWGRGAAATGLFDAVASLPETHSARQAQKRFLAERGIAGAGAAPDAVKLDFLKRAADVYFRTACEAIRRHDPNHLVLGARFAGLWGAHPAVWEVAGKYCDVVTFNCYPWADLDRNVMQMARGPASPRVADAFAQRYALVKRPMLITEWSFPALDSGLPCTGGAGQRFATQKLRAQATGLFAKTMLALPFVVGYDYFMWVDEPAAGISDAFPEDSNYGLVDERGKPYPEITALFADLHENVGTWRRAGLPPTNAVANAGAGLTAKDFLAAFKPGAKGISFSRTGARYAVRNAAGLELEGHVGGWGMLEAVKLKGRTMGRYTGMLNECVDGGLVWCDATKTLAADWREENGRGVLTVTSEARRSDGLGFTMTQTLTVFADKPWFLCELASVKNVGRRPIDVRAFLFRTYAPFALDKRISAVKSVPNLWQAPMCDAWFSKTDGAYFGGFTRASTAMAFNYNLQNNGTRAHPDAVFAPTEELTLAPGASYDPKGAIWMVALCGLDGVDGWRRTIRSFDAAPRGAAAGVRP